MGKWQIGNGDGVEPEKLDPENVVEIMTKTSRHLMSSAQEITHKLTVTIIAMHLLRHSTLLCYKILY